MTKLKSIACLLTILMLSSCGSSRTITKIENTASGTSITVSQSAQGGQTTVTVEPSVAVSADSTKILTK